MIQTYLTRVTQTKYLPALPGSLCLMGQACGQTAQPVAYSSVGSNQTWGNTGWNNSAWNGAGWNNPGGTSAKTWVLGVNGNNTDVGVGITSVSPNSAGARAGLMPGDLIICVNGDQVGLVGSKVFDISEELNHHADSSGRVRLTVQQRTSPQVRVLTVQLDDRQAGLTGSLVIPSSGIPPNSVITVQLENVTRPYYVVRNGQQSFPAPSYAQGRIPFSIDFDPAYIFPTDTYRVRASVISNGATILDTAQPPLVLTQGRPSSAELILTPVSFAFSNAPGGSSVTAGYASYDAATQQITAAYQRYLGRAPPQPNWRPGSSFPIPRCAHRPYSSSSWAAKNILIARAIITSCGWNACSRRSPAERPRRRDGSMDATFRQRQLLAFGDHQRTDDRRRTLKPPVTILGRPANLSGCSGTGTTRPSRLARWASALSNLKFGISRTALAAVPSAETVANAKTANPKIKL